MKHTPITIISAELPHLDFYANTERTAELRQKLIDMGLSFVGISTVDSNKKCQSFMVSGNCSPKLINIARKFGQEFVLHSDSDRNSGLLSTEISKKPVMLGKLYQTSKHDALSRNSYLTFSEDGKDYYYVTGEKENAAAIS